MRQLLFLGGIIFFLFSTPLSYAKQPLTLSLDDAVLLAVRTNPNVQSSQLNYLAQKFNLSVQAWAFYPHYAFETSALFTRSGSSGQPALNAQNYAVQPSVSLLTPIGTQLGFAFTNSETSHYNPGLSLQVMQPLLRGFGRAVVEAALNNAKDTEVIACLTIGETLQNTVTAVVNAYLNIVSAEKTILIDEDAVRRAEKSVEQTQLFIKAGHKAGNELVTVEANVASAKSQWVNDKNNLTQARYALLAAIGIDPNTALQFSSLNVQRLIKKYPLPTLVQTKEMALANNIQYQIDNITLHGPAARTLLLAEDNTRWQLNFTANIGTGSGNGSGQNAGLTSLFNGANQAQSIGLALQIPIDDQLAKQAVVNAKIALKQAELALMQEKWGIETNAINGWNLVISAEQALHFAEDAEKLQNKTYNISFQKYLHGLIDSLELQSAQLQLIQSQQTLLNAQINYLRALVNLDLLIGNTLKTWHVMVRTS